MSEFIPFDKTSVAQSFGQAAKHYDQHAFIQREVGDRLLEKLNYMKINPKRILDIGCGTGHFTQALKRKFKKADVIGLDISELMIKTAKQQQSGLTKLFSSKCEFLVGDMDALPFKDNEFDLIFSNLTLQWTNNPLITLKEVSRVLSPSGLLLYTTLGPDTLKELRASFAEVDDQVHVNPFLDLHHWGDAMLTSGIHQPVVDRDDIQFHFESLKQMMVDLKGVGAHNINKGRPSSLMSKGKWQQMSSFYETHFKNDLGFCSTYEVIYGHGWGQFSQSKNANAVSNQSAISIKEIF